MSSSEKLHAAGIRLDGQTALVTGGGRGIGKGCAELLAAAGAKVVLNDRPGSEDLHRTVSQLAATGVDVLGVEADVFRREGCERLVAEVLERLGRLDILVSNPARSIRSPFLEFDPAAFEDVINGTLVASFHMSQLVARHLAERGEGGKIVFISSVQAEMPLALSTAYNAAKAGLNHMARTIAVELCEHRINVNVIEPGWTLTPGEIAAFGMERIDQEGPQLPWGRLATPRDIGQAVLFLASPQADYITGSVLPVDGGFRFRSAR